MSYDFESDFDFESDCEKFGFTQVGEINSGGGYEWAEGRIWRRKEDGALFWHGDSGCSCNGFEPDPKQLDALTAATLPDLERWVDGNDHWFSLEERQRFKRLASGLIRKREKGL